MSWNGVNVSSVNKAGVMRASSLCLRHLLVWLLNQTQRDTANIYSVVVVDSGFWAAGTSWNWRCLPWNLTNPKIGPAVVAEIRCCLLYWKGKYRRWHVGRQRRGGETGGGALIKNRTCLAVFCVFQSTSDVRSFHVICGWWKYADSAPIMRPSEPLTGGPHTDSQEFEYF